MAQVGLNAALVSFQTLKGVEMSGEVYVIDLGGRVRQSVRVERKKCQFKNIN